MNFNIPNDVNFIINTLSSNGYEGFMVGGCIRDLLLNKTPHDYDIATSAPPEDTLKLFDKTIPTGLKHGTITILINNTPYEVTTYRTEGEYKDNRRPEEVIFVSNIKEDLSRRDFTINAFAYNETDGLIDYFNGFEDLNNQLIRCVGDSDKRFKEDALRMMRAIRFSSQLDFDIEENTLKAIKSNSNLITNISNERIRDELCKILLSKNPRKGFLLLKDTGLLTLILPELQQCIGIKQYTPYHFEDVFNHILSVLDNCLDYNNLNLRISALLHDIGKPYCFTIDENGMGHFYNHQVVGADISKQILTRLKFDNKTIDEVSLLVKEHMSVMENPKDSAIKRLINRVGVDNIFALYTLQRADINSLLNPENVIYKIDFIENRTTEILNEKLPLSIKDLNINGKDLISTLEISPGKKVGYILNCLLELVLENPSLNSKEQLVNLASEIAKGLEH
ncbi:MAG: CCA tRNA nucleotidyltransferase [Clostridium sp.]